MPTPGWMRRSFQTFLVVLFLAGSGVLLSFNGPDPGMGEHEVFQQMVQRSGSRIATTPKGVRANHANPAPTPADPEASPPPPVNGRSPITGVQRSPNTTAQRHESHECIDTREQDRPLPWRPSEDGSLAADPGACLVYIHIAKAGGRYMDSILENAAKHIKGASWHSKYTQHWDKLPPHHTFLGGHWTFSLYNQPGFQKCFRLTVLRDPVARAISALGHHGHVEKPWTWDEVLQYNDGCPCCVFEYHDDMTRILSGRSHWDHYDPAYVVEARYDLEEEDLEAAKCNLRSFDVVCFNEDMGACRRALERLGVPVDAPSKAVGKSRRTCRDGDDDLARIAAHNTFDQRLYDWAVENCALWGTCPEKVKPVNASVSGPPRPFCSDVPHSTTCPRKWGKNRKSCVPVCT